MNRLRNPLLSLVAISAPPQPSESTLIRNGSNSIVRNFNGTTVQTYNEMTNTTVQDKTKKCQEAATIIKKSQIVCFDVDSTVIKEEGIDELAAFCGKGAEVSRLTKEAMTGSMTFQEALRKRLDIINPSQKQIREFIKAHPSTLSQGIRDFMDYLKDRQIKVFLVSGGFDCLIEPVATELGIPLENVFANKLLFTFKGDFAGFDTNQPTSRSGGKAEAISQIRNKLDKDTIVTMIGDGATDLEASPPANYFIGYGGNIVREEVRNRSNYYITDFSQLIDQSDEI